LEINDPILEVFELLPINECDIKVGQAGKVTLL
jgi:hypothetical protein